LSGHFLGQLLDDGLFFSDAFARVSQGDTNQMKNLKKLGLILSVGTIAALTIGGCGDDPVTPGGGAGMSTGGTTAAGTTSGGTTAAGTSSGGGGSGGTASGGGGSGGTSAGGGGSGGMSGGTGGTGGSGGAGGTGGAAGGGGGPSADCAKWCTGPMGVVTFCMGAGLADAVNTEQKCIAHCTAPEAAGNKGLSCWNEHLANAIKAMPDAQTAKTTHCPHASGAATQDVCNKTM
jgi:hypothetical protein